MTVTWQIILLQKTLNIACFGVKFRMSKRKKGKKLKEKIEAEKKTEDKCENFLAEKNSNFNSEENQESLREKINKDDPDISEKNDFAENVKKLTKDLYYISETDAEFSVFVGEKTDSVSKKEILRQIKNSPDAKVEEKDFNEFFARLTKIQDWFEKEEIEDARRFGELEKLLRENLTDKKVFKIGEVQLEIYVVGLDEKSNLSGLKTEAVET